MPFRSRFRLWPTGFKTLNLPKNLINSRTLHDDFESLTGWQKMAGNNPALDVTNFRTGSASIRMTNTGTVTEIRKLGLTWDMSVGARISLDVYVYGGTSPSIRLALYAPSHSHYFYCTKTLAVGWNHLEYIPANWSTVGSPSWNSPVVEINIKCQPAADGDMSVDSLYSNVSRIPVCLFTFDDEFATLYNNAFAYMKSRNAPGTEYVVTDHVGTATYMTWPQLQEMQAAGWIIGNHTKDHDDLATLSEANQEITIAAARTALVANVCTGGDHLAAPAGSWNADTATAFAALSMKTMRGPDPGGSSPLFMLEFQPAYILGTEALLGHTRTLAQLETLVDNAKTNQQIIWFYGHGISDAAVSSTNFGPIASFQALVAYVIAQGLPIITINDLYRLMSGPVTVRRQI